MRLVCGQAHAATAAGPLEVDDTKKAKIIVVTKPKINDATIIVWSLDHSKKDSKKERIW